MTLEQRIRAREAELQIIADHFQRILLATMLPQVVVMIERESK